MLKVTSDGSSSRSSNTNNNNNNNNRSFKKTSEKEGSGTNLIRRLSSKSEKDVGATGSSLNRRLSIYKKPDNIIDGGVIHTIPDIELPLMNFSDQYNIEKTLAEGCFARILLAFHRPTNTKVVLKAVHAELTSSKDFIKEFHFNYQLSHHRNILSAYNVCFKTKDYYVYAAEYAPHGDLATNLGVNGLHETACKSVAEQLSSALGFMHSKNLVHRDLKLENVLVFAPDFSRVKLCDFGKTTKKGVLVNKVKHTWITFVPPELLEIVKNERFICKPSSDVWQFGVLLYTILTGTTPWGSADWMKDSSYCNFMKYEQRKSTKVPDNFKKFSARLMRCFRKYLTHEPDDRCKVTEVTKYMKDRWVECKITSSKSQTLICPKEDQDSICVYLKEGKLSGDENKMRFKRLMSSYGLETPIDQTAVRKRVIDWLSTCDNNFDREIESLVVVDVEVNQQQR